jgi:cleavage and polyadenylation specificity factor subunit 2
VPDNVVLLTGRSEEGTLGRILFDRWNNSQREDSKWDKGKIGSNIMMDGVMKLQVNVIELCSSFLHNLTQTQMKSKVPLQGAELEAYLKKERDFKDKEAAHQAAMARNQRMLEADEDETDSDLDSDSDEEDEVEQVLGDDSMDVSGGADQSVDERIGRRRKVDKNGDGADWTMDGDEGLTKQLLSYDIYLKGNVSRATSFFKSAGGQTQRFRMFPYVEKKRRVDEYGETIDVGMWLRKGKVLEEDAESDEVKEMKRRQQADNDAKVGQKAISVCVRSIGSFARKLSGNRLQNSFRLR